MLSGSSVLVIAWDHRLSCPVSATGIPSISEMILAGRTAAKSATTSTVSRSASSESVRFTTDSVRSLQTEMAFGVKARATRLRRREWSAPSWRSIIRWFMPPLEPSRAASASMTGVAVALAGPTVSERSRASRWTSVYLVIR